MQSKFELDITNPATVSYLHTSMSAHYSGFRNTLKKHFSKFSNIEEANKNKPSDVEKDEDWKFLCSFFSTEEHKVIIFDVCFMLKLYVFLSFSKLT